MNLKRCIVLVTLALPLAACPITAVAQARVAAATSDDEGPNFFREHYTKHEYRIAMRDGVKLFTAVYAPKDDSQTYPILLTRTPYSVRRTAWTDVSRVPAVTPRRASSLRYQDVRGRYGSEGEFVDMRPHNPAQDRPARHRRKHRRLRHDRLAGQKRVPNNNGHVGMMGNLLSRLLYGGRHDRLSSRAEMRLAPGADLPIGSSATIFTTTARFIWPTVSASFPASDRSSKIRRRERAKPFDFKTPDGYEFYLNLGPLANADKLYFKGKIAFWDELMRHGTYDDFWQSRDLRPAPKNIKAAVMTVGGWFDAEDLFGALAVYRAVERNNPGTHQHVWSWGHGRMAAGRGEAMETIWAMSIPSPRRPSSTATRSSCRF